MNQNQWDRAEAVIREISWKTREIQVNNLILHLEKLEKDQQQINPNISRKKEIIKIRAETK